MVLLTWPTRPNIKAEHVVDLDSGMILGAEITPADMHDTKSLEDTLHKAQIHLEAAGSDIEICDVAADKGYHSTEALTELSEHTNYRSYIPEPKTPDGRNWSTPPEGTQGGSGESAPSERE